MEYDNKVENYLKQLQFPTHKPQSEQLYMQYDYRCWKWNELKKDPVPVFV